MTKSSWRQLFSLPLLTLVSRSFHVRDASQNIVGMGLNLQQVICDTLDSYILIDPLPVIYVHLILIVCAFVLVRRPGPIMMRF